MEKQEVSSDVKPRSGLLQEQPQISDNKQGHVRLIPTWPCVRNLIARQLAGLVGIVFALKNLEEEPLPLLGPIQNILQEVGCY